MLHLKKLASQKPFLNPRDIENLKLSDDRQKTDMTITGKLNPEDDTIFLKVQITDKDGTISTFSPLVLYDNRLSGL